MFQGLQKPHQLKMGGEIGLIPAVLEDGRFHLQQYGHLVARALKKHNKSGIWMACLFASNYWRILGHPSEAIQCQQKAFHLSPKIWKFSALLSMANVFHRTHNSDDAVTVLQKAIELAPENPALYFTLGNVQATLLNFNESVESFQTAVKLQPTFAAAKKRQHAVLCHQKLEKSLEEQQNALQETLNELKHYKKQHDKWTQLLTKIINEQASLETRMQTTMGYEHAKIKLQMSENKQHGTTSHRKDSSGAKGNCIQTTDEEGNIYLTCSITTIKETTHQVHLNNGGGQVESGKTNERLKLADIKLGEKATLGSKFDEIDELLKRFESRIEAISGLNNPTLEETANGESSQGKNVGKKKSKPKAVDVKSDLKGDYKIRPTLKPIYSKYPDEQDKGRRNLKTTKNPDWPTAEACDPTNMIKEWKEEYPTVFLSPESKGFE